jgi:hypothetical protein
MGKVSANAFINLLQSMTLFSVKRKVNNLIWKDFSEDKLNTMCTAIYEIVNEVIYI